MDRATTPSSSLGSSSSVFSEPSIASMPSVQSDSELVSNSYPSSDSESIPDSYAESDAGSQFDSSPSPSDAGSSFDSSPSPSLSVTSSELDSAASADSRSDYASSIRSVTDDEHDFWSDGDSNERKHEPEMRAVETGPHQPSTSGEQSKAKMDRDDGTKKEPDFPEMTGKPTPSPIQRPIKGSVQSSGAPSERDNQETHMATTANVDFPKNFEEAIESEQLKNKRLQRQRMEIFTKEKEKERKQGRKKKLKKNKNKIRHSETAINTTSL